MDITIYYNLSLEEIFAGDGFYRTGAWPAMHFGLLVPYFGLQPGAESSSPGTPEAFTTFIPNTFTSNDQWPFQDARLEVPTIYKAYIRPM
jgi:hypothetical protein